MPSKKDEGKIGLRATAGKRTLAFGLVRIGIGMAPAVDDAKPRVSANYICPEHNERVSQKYECPHGHDIEGRPERAYKHGDVYVVLDESELPKVEGDELIALEANVAAADVPSEYVERTRLIWPQTAADNEAFGLLAAYLRDNDRALIGNTVEYGTSKALVIRYSRTFGTLVAQVLLYDAQVRHGNIEIVRAAVEAFPTPAPEMAAMAAQLLEAIPGEFDWQGVEDEYGQALEEAIAAKAAGATPAPKADKPVEAATDLMAALKASVEASEREEVAA